MIGGYNLDTQIDLEAFPVPGETILARGSRKSHGGKGSNQAVQAARCGAGVSLIARIGGDGTGQAALDFWRAEGIDVSAVSVHAGLPTGSAAILVDGHGENIIVVDPGANAALSPDAAVAELSGLDPVPKLVVTQLETPVAVAQAVFRWARDRRVTTLLNAAPLRAPLAATMIDLTDILVVNEIEAVALTGPSSGTQDATAAARQLASQVRLAVVLTRGPDGASLYRPDAAPHHAVSPPTDVRDTTGAGDAFIGAFAAELVAGESLETALGWGVAAGSFACRGQGAAPSYGVRAALRAAWETLVRKV